MVTMSINKQRCSDGDTNSTTADDVDEQCRTPKSRAIWWKIRSASLLLKLTTCTLLMSIRPLYYARGSKLSILSSYTGCCGNRPPYFRCVVYGSKQTENFMQTCPRHRTHGFFIVTTFDINSHENNSYFPHQYQELLLPLSSSCSTHAKLSQHLLEVSALYR